MESTHTGPMRAMRALHFIDDFWIQVIRILLFLQSIKHLVENIFEEIGILLPFCNMFFNSFVFGFYYVVKFIHIGIFRLSICVTFSILRLRNHVPRCHSLEIGHFKQSVYQFDVIFRLNQIVNKMN